MLTPFLGEMASASIVKAVVAAAGPGGRALVFADGAIARALALHGFRVVQVLANGLARRPRRRGEVLLVRATPVAPPYRAAVLDVVVCAGHGAALRGAAEGAAAAAEVIRTWAVPLAPGGRLVLIDRIDGGLLGARPVPSREDLCAALLAARLSDLAQVTPRAGTVVTRGIWSPAQGPTAMLASVAAASTSPHPMSF